MLRLCPVISTPHPEAYARLLTAAGLACVGAEAGGGSPTWQLFNSGNGKIAVEYAPVHAIRLEFELRDAALFVQRTLADGTRAELLGQAALVTAADFTFLARPVTDLALADPRSTPSVTAVWTSDNPARANTVLANIGAKKLHDLSLGGAVFRAKNGGVVRTAAGAGTGVELQVDCGGPGPVRHGMPDGGHLTIVGGSHGITAGIGAGAEDGVELKL